MNEREKERERETGGTRYDHEEWMMMVSAGLRLMQQRMMVRMKLTLKLEVSSTSGDERQERAS